MLTKDELVEQYRKIAKNYDSAANLSYLFGFRGWRYRKAALDALCLKPGDTVVEIGCGTGLNFGLFQSRIGPTGRIVGTDLNDAMLAVAKERILKNNWENVTLVQGDAADFEFPGQVNGIVSTFAITLVPEYDDVIKRGADVLAPGGRWVIVDLRMPTGWSAMLTPLLMRFFSPFGVSVDLAERKPMGSLRKYLDSVTEKHYYLGFTYVGSGVSRKSAFAK